MINMKEKKKSLFKKLLKRLLILVHALMGTYAMESAGYST
jgi:hypothetical protein